MYLEKQLQEYLDDLASDQPTPGGGSTAALSGAMGAALACMASRLTLNHARYADVHQEIAALLQQAEQLRARFQQLMQEDIAAYAQLSTALKLPRSTDEEKTSRTKAVQAALLIAAQVPLEMVEHAAELAHSSLRIAEIGNKNVLSDIATAATLATSAGIGASWMVRTNLQALKDLERVEAFSLRLNTALDTITINSQQVVNTVRERA